MTDDIKTVAPATATLSVRLNRLWLDAKALLRDGWRAFTQRFLNAETGAGCWLMLGCPSSLAALWIEPDKASYILVVMLSALGSAFGGWLVWVNPVKRQAKRQMAVARKLTDISVADYKKNSKGRTDAGVR